MENKQPRIEEWWVGGQIDLVKDQAKTWELKAFKTTVGFWIPAKEGRLLGKLRENESLPEGAVLDDSAWDHEHCELCFETISDKGTYQRTGYTDGKNWLCIRCYKEYIEPYRSA